MGYAKPHRFKRLLLTTASQSVVFDTPLSREYIRELIGAETLDSFRLSDGETVVLIDDSGHDKGLPINKAATLLYWDRCGGPNEHYIVGDVVVAPDSDFAQRS